jgi:hypothetical protein
LSAFAEALARYEEARRALLAANAQGFVRKVGGIIEAAELDLAIAECAVVTEVPRWIDVSVRSDVDAKMMGEWLRELKARRAEEREQQEAARRLDDAARF